jgi:hypothetical protein
MTDGYVVAAFTWVAECPGAIAINLRQPLIERKNALRGY